MQQAYVNTAMRNAFENIQVKKVSSLAKTIVNVLSTKAGKKPIGRGWTANVSKRTLHMLQAQGVFG